MRVFFAIEFNQEVKDRLFKVQQELRKYCIGGNYSHKENFHLTLRFIGEQNPEQLQKLVSTLHNTTQGATGFGLVIDKLGTFNKGSKKIIWAGLDRSSELQYLYGKLEGALENICYPREQKVYSPHVTLIRETRLEHSTEGFESIGFDKIHIQVGAISLMESKRVDNRLTYSAISRVDLHG